MTGLSSFLPFGATGRGEERIWTGALDQWVEGTDIVVNGVPHRCLEK